MKIVEVIEGRVILEDGSELEGVQVAMPSDSRALLVVEVGSRYKATDAQRSIDSMNLE